VLEGHAELRVGGDLGEGGGAGDRQAGGRERAAEIDHGKDALGSRGATA
jgi:hypothetical protein